MVTNLLLVLFMKMGKRPPTLLQNLASPATFTGKLAGCAWR
jgi:hypothetical protein